MRNRLTIAFLFFAVLMTTTAWAQSYPAADTFSGSGALSSNWTNTTASSGLSYPPVPLLRSSGTVVPNTAASWGLATYTGATFTANQYAQVKFVAHSSAGSDSGPCVQMNTAGTGYCYAADNGLIVAWYVGDYWESAPGISCPIPATGDTIQLSVSGSTLTCSDITKGTSASGSTISGYYTVGNPGLLVDTRQSSVYALTSFQADCVPTCGGGSTPAATPTFSPAAGTYTSVQSVTINDATSGATIHYTTDGSTPTASSTTYSGPVNVSTSETVKAIAVKSGYANSTVGSAAYTINISGGFPVTDTFSGSGALSSNWTNTTAGSGLSYPPVPLLRSSGTVVPNTAASWGLATYTGATFTANQYAQVKFVAHSSAGSDSGPCVQMNTAGTGYCYAADNGLIVAWYVGDYWESAPGISCPIPATGDTIQLSVSGSTLTCSDITKGTSASGSTISGYYTVGNPGLLVDTRQSSVYALTSFQADCVPTCGGGSTPAATPTFSPAAGTYTSAQSVTINDATSGATIYYTTNGTTPTTGSSVYSSPISVSTSETIKAIATATGYTTSSVGSAAYTINLTVATPTFSPGAGTYSSAQTVTISDGTSGATIHYTTDGTTPTASSTTYSAPITVSTSETVKALGVKSGYTNSAVGSAAYTISSGGGKTVSSIAISPQGGVLQSAGTLQLTVQCTYTDSTHDNCAAAGGATWTVSRPSVSSISSSGLFTEIVPPAWQASHAYALGALVTDTNGYIEQAAVAGTSGSSLTWPTPGGSDSAGGRFTEGDYFQDLSNSGYCPCGVVDGGVQWNLVGTTADQSYAIVSAGGQSDRAGIFRQHPGDTWYQYPTPNAGGGTVAVGSTVTIGSGIVVNSPNGGVNGTPFQSACNWSSSNTGIATVDRHGQVTGVSPGSVTITCGRAGNGTFGNSSVSGWVSPGNTTALSVIAGGTGSTTWYVRPDGGTVYSSTNTNGQCSGKVNAAYSGSGTNQACAAGNIRYLWADGITYYQLQWIISGGDTVIVAQNPAGYNTGLDEASPYANPPGPAFVPINCSGNPYCSMPPIPSGSAAHHTRILGANYASCRADSAKTLLHVSYDGSTAFNVTDSQFVDIACFEVTDEAACANNGNYTNSCHDSALNFGSDGIEESALSSNDTYTDIFIHGLGADGIHGATGVGVVADHIHIKGMADAGINMDDDPWTLGNISVAGGLTLTNSITEFTGCVEEYPVVHNYPYIECRDQETGSYADGFGTASTTGNWYFDHDIWQYNYQDGLDLLHSGMQNLTVTNSLSQGNDGQSYKIGSGDNVIFRNNIALANCNRIGTLIGDEPSNALAPGGGAPGNGYNLCRANGNLVLSFTNLGTYQIQNNTIISTNNADTPFGFGCEGGWDSCQNANAQFQNNVTMGYLDNLPGDSDEELPAMFYLGTPDLVNQSFSKSTNMPPLGGWLVRNHNLFYNVRSGSCPTPLQTGETCNTADPQFVGEPASPISHESDLDNFNFTPATGSPLIGAGIAIPGITTDYNGTTRPNPPSIGAVE